MNDTSRRRFLGVVGAATGAVAVAPTAAFAGESHRATGSDEPVVAYVENPRAGELVLLVGEREVVVRDRDLVDRILVAAGR